MRRFATSVLTALVSVSMIAPAFAATTINLQCMQTAVEKREGVFIGSFDTYYASVRSAMITRKDAIKNAWSMSDKKIRNDAVRNAERAFKTSEKNARKTQKDADRNAQKTFKSESKLCEVRS